MSSTSALVGIGVVTVALLCRWAPILVTTSGPGSPARSSADVMRIWADHDWSAGTTSLPISQESLLAKRVLSKSFDGLPPNLHVQDDTVPVALLRAHLNAGRHMRLRDMCPTAGACDLQGADPDHGLAPLHMAAMRDDRSSIAYLMALGADPDAMDRAGRQYRNLSFTNFVRNARRAAEERGSTCQLPEVNLAGLERADLDRSWAEIRRLAHEGEPVAIRGLLGAYDRSDVLDWDLDAFLTRHGHVPVNVGDVPYAQYFGLPIQSMPLSKYVASLAPGSASYVFAKDDGICRDALQILDRFARDALPPYFVSPAALGSDAVHFYLGNKGSGAPFHLHSDAVNLLAHGSKTWFVTPPPQSVYSRTPIGEFAANGTSGIESLRCEQNPGDAIYIPFDWGHAVLNNEDSTFGFAVELLNKRDSLHFLRPSSQVPAGQ
ncbi:JmjC domain-containing protein [Plasmodiophora brassicae]